MRFFVLHPVIGSDAETTFRPIGNPVFGEAPRCPACGRFVGMKPWLPPYKVSLQGYGNTLGDLAFGASTDLLFSGSFLNAWRRERLRGLEKIDSVHVASVQPKSFKNTLQEYSLVHIKRSTVRLDRSHTVLRRPPADCERCGGPGPINAILALRIDESSWAREDIFTPLGVANIVVTENVVRLAADYQLLNITTTVVEDFRWDPLGQGGDGQPQENLS